jgi:hypothetical protein
MNRIRFVEILALRLMREKGGLKTTELTDEINDFIAANNVPAMFAKPVGRGMARVAAILHRLRAAGLVTSGHPRATEAGEKLLESLGEDWKNWPAELWMHNGKIVKSNYPPKV